MARSLKQSMVSVTSPGRLTMPGCRVSAATKWEAARIIVGDLRSLARGSLLDPATWRRVAENYPVVCHESYDSGPETGCYHRDPSEPAGDGHVVGVLWINTRYPSSNQARAWVHELAHHRLHTWKPPALYGERDAWLYHDDRQAVEQEIAQIVERCIFG